MPATARKIQVKDFPESTPADRALITSEEGRITFVYDDAYSPPRKYISGTAIKGNLTAGVGHLLSRGSKVFPEAAKWIGKTIPAAVIDQWLDDDLDDAEKAVNDNVHVPLTSNQRGTLISLTFNIGVDGFANSTLVKKLNKKDYASVPAQLAVWNKTKINGVRVTSKGLVKRRAIETAYWLGGKAPAAAANDNVPQATEIALPAVKKFSPEAILGAGSTVATVTVAGFATSGFLSYVFGGILIVAVLVIAAWVVKRYVFKG